MSLNLANLDEAFSKRYQAKTDQIYANSGLQAEEAYIKVDTQDNKNINFLQTSNYRTVKYTKNPNYHFKRDQVYDLQGIHDGYGAGRNVEVDDKLTRGNLVSKPNDRLAEQIGFIRRIDFLPARHRKISHNKFLVSTTLKSRPQTSFNPGYDTYGVNCRNYKRKSELYYKNRYQRQ